MKPYKAKSGATQFMPSLSEIETMDDNCEGFCLACGETQSAEPDAVRYVCEGCGAAKVYGAAELALRGWCYADAKETTA